MTEQGTEGFFPEIGGGKHFSHPHCNSKVLHAPGDCFYCDKYEERQLMRLVTNTPFSPLEANGWSGNIAVRKGDVHSHLGAVYVVGEGEPDVTPPCSINWKRSWTCTRPEHLEGPCALIPKWWNLAAKWRIRRFR